MAIAAQLPVTDDPVVVSGAPVPTRPLNEDDSLLRRIGEGDERAFRSLVERHVDKAYALALRILRNPTDAEDVVQDVMLKVWSNRGSWQEGRARFSTWLYRVVTNRCLDLCRRPRTSDIDAAPEMADGKPDAVSSIHTGEVNLMLEQAMGQLPDQQRIALILSYHDDLSNPEIAEIMETTVMAVESLLKRGRQQLRRILMTAEAEIRDSFMKI
ncbi:RNA polymerase sigma factor [Devosia sp.]|uniref:RNA polymerase sigma factor n=1 Tax=Devosia sp. TaxID=1871048 RepID=UPI003BA888A1